MANNKTVWQEVQEVVESHLGRDDEANRPLIRDLWELTVRIKNDETRPWRLNK